MAPKKKKKGSGKKKKKGGKKSAPSSAKKAAKVNPADAPVDEVTRQFYLLQIQDLDERVKRYRGKCDGLEVENNDLAERLKKEERDHRENVAVLKKRVLEKEDDIGDVHEQMAALQHERSVEKDAFEQQLTALRAQSADSRETLNREISRLKHELALLDKYREEKDEYEAARKRLEAQLEAQNDEYRQQMEDLDRTSLLKQDRLKKDMLKKISSVATEFRRVSDQQMATTTKYTIEENVGLSLTIKGLEKTVAVTLEENDELRKKCKKQQRELEMLRSTYDEAVKRKVHSEQFAKGLTEMLKAKEEEVMTMEPELERLEDLEEELMTLRHSEYELRSAAQERSEKVKELDHRLFKTSEELQNRNKQYKEVTRVLSRLAGTLQRKIRPQTSGMTSTENSEGDFLESMFAVLRAATDAGVLNTDIATRLLSTSPMEETSFTQSRSPSSVLPPIRDRPSPLVQFRYLPGDLGIVPSLPGAVEAVSKPKTRRRSNEMSVEKRSSAVQTTDIPKALLLADKILVGERPSIPGQHQAQAMLNSRTALTESAHTLQKQLKHHELQLIDSIQKNALMRMVS